MQLDNVENRNCGCNNSLATMNNGMMPVNNDNDYDSVENEIKRNCMLFICCNGACSLFRHSPR